MKILQELESLIPPLSSHESGLLKQSILSEGIREKLIIASIVDKDTGEVEEYLADGHNRYRIAKEFNLDYEVEKKEFASITDVKLWMIKNQNSRRNLTDGWKYELSLIEKELLLEKGREKQATENNKWREPQKSLLSIIDKSEEQPNKPTPHNTQKEIASSLGWSTGKVAMADKVWKQAEPEIKEKVKSGEMSVSAAYQKTKIAAKQKKVTDAVNKSEWTQDQLDLKQRVEKGETVVINMNQHFHLLDWAEKNGLYVRIDRMTEWGNPFELNKDGDRDEVCDAFANHYYPYKKSLHGKVETLKGKVLGCHCHPKRCHGHFLAKQSNTTNE